MMNEMNEQLISSTRFFQVRGSRPCRIAVDFVREWARRGVLILPAKMSEGGERFLFGRLSRTMTYAPRRNEISISITE